MKNLILLLSLLFIKTETVYAEAAQTLQVFYGVSLFEYNLESDQFKANQPMATGQAYMVNYSYQNTESPMEHRFSIFKSAHDLSAPTSLSPSTINATQTHANYKIITTGEQTRIGFGYSFYKMQADETSPNILLTNSESQAIDLYVERSIWHKFNLSVSTFADLELPFIKKEFGTNSGFNQHSYTLHLGYNAKYLFTESWSVVQKSEYIFDSTSYDGQGSRGTLNAKEKSQKFQFLLGAGYDF